MPSLMTPSFTYSFEKSIQFAEDSFEEILGLTPRHNFACSGLITLDKTNSSILFKGFAFI